MSTAARIKIPVDPQRIRSMPRQFAPLDRRFVYEQHIRRLRPDQIALLVFLECVSDPQGLSFYSEERICRELDFSLNGLWDARTVLMEGGFLLYRRPIYQLLDLPQPLELE